MQISFMLHQDYGNSWIGGRMGVKSFATSYKE